MKTFSIKAKRSVLLSFPARFCREGPFGFSFLSLIFFVWADHAQSPILQDLKLHHPTNRLSRIERDLRPTRWYVFVVWLKLNFLRAHVLLRSFSWRPSSYSSRFQYPTHLLESRRARMWLRGRCASGE